MADRDNISQNLFELMEEKKTLALQILDLTRKQAEALKTRDAADEKFIQYLQDLLDKRQKCIDMIDQIDRKIPFLKEKLDRTGGSRELCAVMEDMINDITEILKEAHKINENNRARLKEFMSRLLDRIKSLQAGKLSLKTYTKPPRQVQGFFVDKKK